MSLATMLHVVSLVEPRILVEYQNQLLGILGIDKVPIPVLRLFISKTQIFTVIEYGNPSMFLV